MKLFLSILFFIIFLLMLYYQYTVYKFFDLDKFQKIIVLCCFIIINFFYGVLVYNLLSIKED